MKYPTKSCINCNLKFRIDFKFCPFCGQQNKEELTVALLFYNTFTNYFSFDARFFKSILPLLFKPGYLPTLFVQGKRSIYLHPGQMYLFLSILFFFFITTFIVREKLQWVDMSFKNPTFLTLAPQDTLTVNKGNKIDPIFTLQVSEQIKDKELPEIVSQEVLEVITSDDQSMAINSINFNLKKLDSLLQTEASDKEILTLLGMKEDISDFKKKLYLQALKLYKQKSGGELLKNIYEYLPFTLFILLPIFALLLKIFFYRKGAYSHHLVFSFYFLSFLFFIFILLLVVNQFIMLSTWMNWIIICSTGLYFLFAIRKFYCTSWWVCIFKSGVLSVTYLLFLIPFALVLVSLYGFLVY